MRIKVPVFIEAAHQLLDSDDLVTKKCQNLHGHTYKITVEAQGPNDRHGMVIDFSAIKEIINILDHKFINTVFMENNFFEPSTAENIAKFISNMIKSKYDDLQNIKVSVIEGYKGEGSAEIVYEND